MGAVNDFEMDEMDEMVKNQRILYRKVVISSSVRIFKISVCVSIRLLLFRITINRRK
jgi:hypothetical protein